MRKFQNTSSNSFPLRMAGEGDKVRIVSLRGGKGFQDRLFGMGLNLGAEVEIIQNQRGGKMLVVHEGTRFFLGGGMAQKIHVIPV